MKSHSIFFIFLLLSCSFLSVFGKENGGSISRDSFGVPYIQAKSIEDAYFLAGKAIAEDRLWQMELSRRASRGRLSEIFGIGQLKTDQEVLKTAYFDEELTQQFNSISKLAKKIFTAYVNGINAYIHEARDQKKLPSQFKKFGFEPKKWKVEDSIAIGVQLARKFGSTGSIQLSNYMLYSELKNKFNANDALKIMNDIIVQNDKNTPTTIPFDEDILRKKPFQFSQWSDADSKKQLNELPLPEKNRLLAGISVLDSRLLRDFSKENSIFYKAGSYAAVVSSKLSKLGYPLLLGAPQMGHTAPSVVHELSISAPGYRVSGMNVPGIPGVIVGYTPHIAWTLTSGLASNDDVYCSKPASKGRYEYGISTSELVERIIKIPVKGRPENSIIVKRTHYGPVILEDKKNGHIFSRRSAYWGKECSFIDTLLGLHNAKNPQNVKKLASEQYLSFNLFYALGKGDIGHYYCGKFPQKASGVDARFPTIGKPETEWRGFVPFAKHPRNINPKSGYLCDWNGKPVSWWPNFERPDWGQYHRLNTIHDAVKKQLCKPAGTRELRQIAWEIARKQSLRSLPLLPLIKKSLHEKLRLSEIESEAATIIKNFDGWFIEGSKGALIYEKISEHLWHRVFDEFLGKDSTPGYKEVFWTRFSAFLMRALTHQCQFDYIGRMSNRRIVLDVFRQVIRDLQKEYGADTGKWRYQSRSIHYPGKTRVPYIERGSYIQIVEMSKRPSAVSIVTPGISESGRHSKDQIPLALGWEYKPLLLGKSQ